VRPSSVWLLPAAALSLVACYAEVPGSAPDDIFNPPLLDSGPPGGFGGTLAGGGIGGPDTGLIDPSLDAGTGNDASVAPTCDGVAVGVVQTRKLYAEAQVVSPDTCKSEMQTRTCRNTGWSAWSGTYKAEACVLAPVRSCGDVAHGATESRELYPQEVVNDVALCDPEEQTRECDDGTLGPWSGTATFTTCKISYLGRCSVLSDIECAATSTCTFKSIALGSQCLGNTGHTCNSNAECASAVCLNGVCNAAKVPSGGTCDETADCASCSSSGTTIASTCSASNVCVCNAGATCSTNSQCLGSCVALRCVVANTTCDNDDDCSASSKCVKSSPGPSSTGTCLLRNGQSCTSNAQCEHYCRPVETDELFTQSVCAARGSLDAHCDENIDCTAGLVCRVIGQGPHCATPGTANAIQGADRCDEMADCSIGNSCAPVSTLTGTRCFPTASVNNMGITGSLCTTDAHCASGTCDHSLGMMLGICL
jgi:hypothetical protein